MTPAAKAQLVKTLARDLGFDLVGLTHAAPLARAGYYRDWLAAGYAGTMAYLRRNVQIRTDPTRLLEGARAVICLGVNYRRADGYIRPSDAVALAPDTAQPTGLVAQYARGRDYHVVLRQMLDQLATVLADRLRERFLWRAFVDTGPLLERELAAAAGLGWIGKNTCLLNHAVGSYIFLGELVTTLDLPADQPVADRCGTCTRCLRACPTGCIIGPRKLDASRCISYLTIEHRGLVKLEFHPAIGTRVFGCDVCQQVCPYNARAPVASHPDLVADVMPARLDLLPLLDLRSGPYRRLVAGSAARRAHRTTWQRNAAIAAGFAVPSKDDLLAALEQAARHADPGIAAAAAASLLRIKERHGGRSVKPRDRDHPACATTPGDQVASGDVGGAKTG